MHITFSNISKLSLLANTFELVFIKIKTSLKVIIFNKKITRKIVIYFNLIEYYLNNAYIN